jgi:hypothetical protein
MAITRPLVRLGALLIMASAAAASPPQSARSDPFAFLAPDLAVSAAERTALDRGETVVKVLPGRDGYLALSAIVRIAASAERTVAVLSDVERLQRGKYVPEIGWFSTPPRLEDLRGLTLDPEEVRELRTCRPGDCVFKLSAREIAQMQAIGDDAAGLALAFRRVLVSRATDYATSGDDCAPPYHDHKAPMRPADAFSSVLERLPFLSQHFAGYASYLADYPSVPRPDVQHSFLYWSKETLGMKPIVSITHLSVLRPEDPGLPDAMIVAKQVYANHYRNASISVTAVASDGMSRYLVYVNRAQVDAFRGLFGGFVRRVVERRVKAEAPAVLSDLRRRVESPAATDAPARPGDPPRPR